MDTPTFVKNRKPVPESRQSNLFTVLLEPIFFLTKCFILRQVRCCWPRHQLPPAPVIRVRAPLRRGQPRDENYHNRYRHRRQQRKGECRGHLQEDGRQEQDVSGGSVSKESFETKRSCNSFQVRLRVVRILRLIRLRGDHGHAPAQGTPGEGPTAARGSQGKGVRPPNAPKTNTTRIIT